MYFIFMSDENLGENNTDENCIGWLANEQEAIDFVVNNTSDINETCYDYALIAFIPQGINRVPTERIWFKFNHDTKKYDRIEMDWEISVHHGYLA
jgi:hypothetical protein